MSVSGLIMLHINLCISNALKKFFRRDLTVQDTGEAALARQMHQE